MFTNRWYACCAVISAFTFSNTTIVQAQDEPNGRFVQETAVAQAAADPAVAAGESPEGEKSVLNGELSAKDATHGQDFCRCVGESDSTAVTRIEAALSKPLGSNGLDFSETPLEEVVNILQEEYGIPIQIDHAALDATGLSHEEQITINLHNISLRSALRLMLKRLQLTYIIQDEVLLITTPEEAEAGFRTCVYNIRSFVEDTSDKSIDALIDTIVSCVCRETWKENGGGNAEIRALKPGLLVISQTQAVHEEIVSLLNAVRDMRDAHVHDDHAAGEAK